MLTKCRCLDISPDCPIKDEGSKPQISPQVSKHTWNPSGKSRTSRLRTAERLWTAAGRAPSNFPSISTSTSSSSSCLVWLHPNHTKLRSAAPYLAAGPSPGRRWAPWSRASSRPSSLPPHRLSPSSRLCCTSCGVAWRPFSTETKWKANKKRKRPSRGTWSSGS